MTGELTRRDDPYLLLLHGTFSSTTASFHHLLASREWADLWNAYDGRILARSDAALGRILLNMAQGQIEHDEGAVLALYRREFEIGATTRQRSTVLENLKFMAVILQAKGKPDQAAVMERMLENLTA